VKGLDKATVDSRLNGSRGNLSSYKGEIRHNESLVISHEGQVTSYQKALRQTNAKLRNLIKKNKDSGVVVLNDIKIAIAMNPYVDIDNVFFSVSPISPNSKKKPMLNFTFSGLHCRPNKQPYVNLMDDTFPLRDIRIQISLEDYKVKMLPLIGEENLQVRGYQGYRVHPHMLNHDIPCLGDFMGSVVETIQEKEWETMVAVLQSFLEQAYNADAAGKHWPKWMIGYYFPEMDTVDHKMVRFEEGTCYCVPIGHSIKYNVPFIVNGEAEEFIGKVRDVNEFIRVYLKKRAPIIHKKSVKKARPSVTLNETVGAIQPRTTFAEAFAPTEDNDW